MSKANLGWLYYKEMYKKGNDDTHIKSTFNKILQVNAKDESLNLSHSFTLKTIYPGLIIGSGYVHGLSSEEDVKMGFYFDHTSGIPTLPGSSIKGVLRSLFGYGKNEHYKEEKREFIRELLDKPTLDVDALAEMIFEGKKDNKPLSIYKRDKFYEARIIQTAGGILQEDYITPHKNSKRKKDKNGELIADQLCDPNPIKIVKVRGGTSFELSFELHDSDVVGVRVTADEKLKLFFELLQFHGIGAKTNVGYGQFESKDAQKMMTELRLKKDALKEEQQKALQEQAAQKAEEELQNALSNADTNVKKIELAIANLTDRKDVHEIISSYDLEESEKEELLVIIEKQIGPKPAPKNKAAIKWAIKIYELLGK